MKASPHLIPRAALVRLRSLDIGGLNDYYLSTSAESSSTLAASAPELTNMYVLAYGIKEGLVPGERLENYGNSVRLVRTLAYGCPRGLTADSVQYGAIDSEQLAEITTQLNCVSAVYRELDLAGIHQSSRAGTSSVACAVGRPGELEKEWTLVMQAGEHPSHGTGAAAPEGAADALCALTDEERADPLALARRADKMVSSNREVVVAEWRKAPSPPSASSPQTEDELLVENGVCFSSPEQAGLRVLRAARLTFMSMVERTANSVRDAQRCRTLEDHRPLSVLDVSGIDFTFSHAAVQATMELGLHSESQCRISFAPLTRRAAQQVGGTVGTFVRQIMQEPAVPHADPFRFIPARSVDVGAYTAFLSLSPPDSAKSKGDTHRLGMRRATFEASLQLARALTAMRKGSSMLVSFVPTPSSAAAINAQVCHSRRAEVAMESSAVREAKTCVAAAISRTGRWGYITDEVLPLVDCPQGSAVSLVVTLE